jgi:hypothetical protein
MSMVQILPRLVPWEKKNGKGKFEKFGNSKMSVNLVAGQTFISLSHFYEYNSTHYSKEK